MPSVHDELTEQFRRWEVRGRGWRVYPKPVCPEPPFAPFRVHSVSAAPVIDDGHRPTFLSSLVKTLTAKPQPPQPIRVCEEEPEPCPLARGPLVELQTMLPADLDIGNDVFEQFLRSLSLCREPIAFELVGSPSRVAVQFAAHPGDAPLLGRQLRAYFPEAQFQESKDGLLNTWNACEAHETIVVEFGLAREFMFSLATGKLDPFIGIVGALSGLAANEFGLFQVLFQATREEWAESIIRSVTGDDRRPFFVNEPELANAAEEKVRQPLYAAVVRIAITSESYERTLQLACDMASSLRVFANPQGNELIPLENSEYPSEDHLADALSRQSRRSGMLLTSDELTGFVHVPGSAVRSPAFARNICRSKSAPAIVKNSAGLLLGDNIHNGVKTAVRLTPNQRVQHMHIIGASGTGKSTLLFNLLRQDIENGEGVALLDPHGDLVDKVLGIIPEARINDVILIDPSDEEYSVGFNILSAHSDLEKTLLASDLVSVFQRLSTSWGDQMNSVLQNAILAFLESSLTGTLSDLRRFLLEPAYRSEFLKSVRDSELLYYWQKAFPQLAGNRSVGPIITRLDTFLAPKPIRYMVSQPRNGLDFADIMDSGKIFLAKLPEGLLGKENSYLLGALLVGKFQQLAMARQAKQIAARRDFWIFIDEFHQFITPSMAQILSGARKYRIGLTLAHQELQQLERNRDVASAVMSNPATRIVFRVGDADARKLAEGFSYFEAKDLQNLETGQAIARVERADFDFNLSVPLPTDPKGIDTAALRAKIITASREKYASPRAEVEAALFAKLEKTVTQQERLGTEPAAPAVPKDAEGKTAPRTVDVPKPAIEEKSAAKSTEVEDREHVAIQKLICKEAAALDYTATSEEPLPTGRKVDVVLRRGKQLIGCEISVTNTVEYEAAINITKCLEAGFGHVASICADRRKLGKIQQQLAAMTSADRIAKVGFYVPNEFISKLFDWAAADPEGGAIERGKPGKRKIALGSCALTESERTQREENMLEQLRRAMKRPGGATSAPEGS